MKDFTLDKNKDQAASEEVVLNSRPSQLDWQGLRLNPFDGEKNFSEVEIKPIDQLRWIQQDDGSWTYVSDVQLLLNEKRIVNELGSDNWNKIVQSFGAPSQRYKPGQYSDDDLLRTVKSRYLQTPSEVKSWLDTWKLDAVSFEENAKELQRQFELAKANLDNSGSSDQPSGQSSGSSSGGSSSQAAA